MYTNLSSLFLVNEEPIEEFHLNTIKNKDELIVLINFINAALNHIDHVARTGYQTEDEDKIVLKLIVYCFNNAAASFRMGMLGYWNPSLAAMRGLLETIFLIDLLTSTKEVLQWSNMEPPQREREYSPIKVRCRLDKRDGLSEKKRLQRYKLLSNYGTHPTPEGFTIISPEGTTQRGPFPSERNLRAVLQELAMRVDELAILSCRIIKNAEDNNAAFARNEFLASRKFLYASQRRAE